MFQKLLPFAVLYFCLINILSAQLSWGVSGGINATIWDWRINDLNTSLNYEPGIGWRAAASLSYQFSPMLEIRGTLANQQIGNRLSNVTDPNGNLIPNSRVSEHYNTIGVGVLAKVSPNQQKQGLYLLAGPGLAYITNGWRRFSAGLNQGSNGASRSTINLQESQIHRMQWFADLGLGYDLTLNEVGMLALEFRYQLGLSGITRSPFVSSRLHTALLNLGYWHTL